MKHSARAIAPAWLACAVLLSMSLGCTRIADPCPPGESLRQDLDFCMSDEAGTELTESGVLGLDASSDDAEPDAREADTGEPAPEGGEEDADTPDLDAGPEAGELDAQPEAGELDAQPETGAPDAGPDALVDAELGASADGSPDASDAQLGPDADAAPDADAGEPVPLLCSEADRTDWHDFHLSTQLVFDVGACSVSDPSCSGSSCALANCLLKRLRIRSCEDCAAQEVACVAAACAQPCMASNDDQACRACACHNGCIAAFEACSGGVGDLCADCNATTCTNRSSPPVDLLMVILRQATLP